ncbi:class I SAM-dependent methyltransferase [Acetanaerobacterium elongatum]|uniref:Ubiquinone/menaquinone biosynthesis C-methylase UbiE n=1 Tax=Acetanaerobacterium elongatum TaxID=258515 RepID=A0A1G9VR66_9FIRM|nr:class I SAM-dependent methyltransferase [Acetanaerobacterium elongatum]SDM74640.1 Ubiquinone/menaquinone biosynthesis C-methylase UbiE [Acetanaerobacterium elongatum]
MAMQQSYNLNADRFTGIAQIYDTARPAMPDYVPDVIERYLGSRPDTVVDLGCGTGLSILAWLGHCTRVIGIDASEDMLAFARRRESEQVRFIKAFSHDTGLDAGSVDAVVCSQSFHWMNPADTLAEVNRVLKPGGIFATVDNDWPPVCGVAAELAYQELTQRVLELEQTHPAVKDTFVRFGKDEHLNNIKKSGYFRYVRELVFANSEQCDAARMVGLVMSQGGLQTVLKHAPEEILVQLEKYKEVVKSTFKHTTFSIDFCYRMRIGVK